MKLHLKRRDNSVDAVAEYDADTGTFTVLKGSVVSKSIAIHTKFRSAKSVEKARADGVVNNSMLMNDMIFKSASSAANFVTGTSTNGLVAWKDEQGRKFKDILMENKA